MEDNKQENQQPATESNENKEETTVQATEENKTQAPIEQQEAEQADIGNKSYKEIQQEAKATGVSKVVGVSKDALIQAIADIQGKPVSEIPGSEESDESSNQKRGRKIDPLTDEQLSAVEMAFKEASSKSAAIRTLLFELPEEHKMTRGQIARALDVRYQMVYQIETKERNKMAKLASTAQAAQEAKAKANNVVEEEVKPGQEVNKPVTPKEEPEEIVPPKIPEADLDKLAKAVGQHNTSPREQRKDKLRRGGAR